MPRVVVFRPARLTAYAFTYALLYHPCGVRVQEVETACKMIFEFASALGDRFYPFAECTLASGHSPSPLHFDSLPFLGPHACARVACCVLAGPSPSWLVGWLVFARYSGAR